MNVIVEGSGKVYNVYWDTVTNDMEKIDVYWCVGQGSKCEVGEITSWKRHIYCLYCKVLFTILCLILKKSVSAKQILFRYIVNSLLPGINYW